MKHCSLLPAFFLVAAISAEGACPKTKQDWQSQGPKLFLESALEHLEDSLKNDASGLQDKIGKKGSSATSRVTPFKEKNKEFVMVETRDDKASLILGGVMKCDHDRKEAVLLSLSWIKGDKSGLVKLSRK